MDVRPRSSLLLYRLGPVPVSVHANDADVRQAVAAVLDYFGLRPQPTTDVRPGIRLAFAAHSRLAASSSEDVRPTHARLVTRHNGVDVRRTPEAWWLCERGNTVRLDLGRGAASGVIRSPMWKTASTLHLPFVNLVIHSLLLLLRPKGYVPLHTAALAKDGLGMLLVAASDSGKSTQAMGLVRAGWHYLTDDSALLCEAGGAIEVLPLRRDFGLDAAARDVFPEMIAHARPFLTDERKRRVNMAALYPGQAAERCTPRLLLFPQIADQAESEFFPLGQKDVLFRLMEQSVLLALDPELTAPHLGKLRLLSGQAPGYRLLAGRDLKHHPERLAGLVAPVLPQHKKLA